MVRTGSIFPGPGPNGADSSREGSSGSFQSESINMFENIEEEDDEKNAGINGAGKLLNRKCLQFWLRMD